MEEIKQSNEKEEDFNLLQLVEKYFSNPNIYVNVNTIKEIFLQIFKHIEKNQFLLQFSQNIQNKQIYFIRHAQSEYNQWKKDNLLNPFAKYKNITSNYDPELTPKGLQQCQQLVTNLNNNQQMNQQFQILYCSPLSRTIQTTQQVKKANCFKNIKKAVATDLLREKSGKASQIGANLKDLKDRYDEEIDFSFIVRYKWWNFNNDADEQSTKKITEKQEIIVKEKKENVLARLALFLVYISFKPENRLCIVSHSKIYKALEDYPIFSWASNAEGIWLKNKQLISLVVKFIEKL